MMRALEKEEEVKVLHSIGRWDLVNGDANDKRFKKQELLIVIHRDCPDRIFEEGSFLYSNAERCKCDQKIPAELGILAKLLVL